jgi:hypothetical protein
MNQCFRTLITQKSAQLQLVMNALDEFLLADLRTIGDFSEQEQEIAWGMMKAAGIAKLSFNGLLEIVKIANETRAPEAKTGNGGEEEAHEDSVDSPEE